MHSMAGSPPSTPLEQAAMSRSSLPGLPRDILVMVPEYIHDIEDYMNLASTCRELHSCMGTASPNTILRLAAAQSRVFFRPSPRFLVAATARELGNWARLSDENEQQLVNRMREKTVVRIRRSFYGKLPKNSTKAVSVRKRLNGLLELALEHCGITMERIRLLMRSRHDVLKPIGDLVTPITQPHLWGDIWTDFDGSIVSTHTHAMVIQLATYGELFAPDFESLLNGDDETRRLKVATRLAFIENGLEPPFRQLLGPDDDRALAFIENDTEPSFGDLFGQRFGADDYLAFTDEEEDDEEEEGEGEEEEEEQEGEEDAEDDEDEEELRLQLINDMNQALCHLLCWDAWLRPWRAFRTQAATDFQDDTAAQGQVFRRSDMPDDWRQRMYESLLMCQGWESLEMLRPCLQDHWFPKIRQWRNKIAELDREPPWTEVGGSATLEYPWLLGNLEVVKQTQ